MATHRRRRRKNPVPLLVPVVLALAAAGGAALWYAKKKSSGGGGNVLQHGAGPGWPADALTDSDCSGGQLVDGITGQCSTIKCPDGSRPCNGSCNAWFGAPPCPGGPGSVQGVASLGDWRVLHNLPSMRLGAAYHTRSSSYGFRVQPRRPAPAPWLHG